MTPIESMAAAIKATVRRFGRGDITDEFAQFTALAALRALRENVSPGMVEAATEADRDLTGFWAQKAITAALRAAEEESK